MKAASMLSIVINLLLLPYCYIVIKIQKMKNLKDIRSTVMIYITDGMALLSWVTNTSIMINYLEGIPIKICMWKKFFYFKTHFYF